jgi:hypothetical protein
MRTRTIGFGTGEGTEGVVVSPDILKEEEHPEKATAEYLREIRDRYVLPGGMEPQVFNLAANVAQKFDKSQTTYNAFMLTVTAGVALVYFGDYTNYTGVAGNTPHFTLSAAISPQSQVVPLPPGAYIFTIQADNSGACTGCFTPMAL